jgi:hypothetical protein
MKKFILIITIFLLSTSANASCKFDLDFGDDASKVLDKYGPPMPGMFKEIAIIPVPADEVCPNQMLKDIAIEYRFFNEKLAAINLIALNDEKNSVSDRLTLMKYAKRVYGKFDTGQNSKAYVGYKIFEKNKFYVVYQKLMEDKIINEQIYISTDEYDKLLSEFYNKAEEEMETGPKEN